VTERDIFIAALQQDDPAERRAYLDEACAGQPGLREQVEGLLRLHENAGSFLEQPAAQEGTTSAGATGHWINPVNPPRLSLTEGPGTRIGPYKLLQQIGEGGMGVVYMAEQEEPVRRKVALKIIKPGMDSRQVIARFEAERQALALMDHQNIARVLDAGTTGEVEGGGWRVEGKVEDEAFSPATRHAPPATPSGRPFFVMELVKGVPITEFCDEQHLTLRERLELFVPVCQAIQHAHQKGIIHRDIKPSNVLVTLYDGKPVPKVIDFGVAKAIEQRLTERTLFTQLGQVVGTVEYMSPEQAELNALDIDTRSDIYSLGVLLYELLTGSTPLEKQKLRSAAFAEMLRMIREDEPAKPSTRLSASGDRLPSISAQRKTEPAKLAKLVRGELDWIVMKALEKDRGRRYETANGFARDIERYLTDEPVEACPPSAAYKLRKFARKNRTALATAGAFVILLAAAAVVSTSQAIRARQAEGTARRAQKLAEERFNLAKDAVDKYLNEVTEDPELKNANFERLRKRLLETALPFYQKLTDQAPGDPAREAARGRAYQRLGDIGDDLGEEAAALADYQAMHAIFARLAKDFPAEPGYRAGLSKSLFKQGGLLQQIGRIGEAEAAFRAALAIAQQLVNDFASVPDYRQLLGDSHNDLGALLRDLGKHADAEFEYRAALEEHHRLVDEHPNVPDYRKSLTFDRINLGFVLSNVGKQTEAEAEYRAALNEKQRLAAEYPNVPDYRSSLAFGHNSLGALLFKMGKHTDAEAEYRAVIRAYHRLAEEHPSVPGYRKWLAGGHNNLGAVLSKLGKHTDAEAQSRAAIKEFQRLTDEHPGVADYRRGLASSHMNLGIGLNDLGKFAEAGAECRAAIKELQRLAAGQPNVPDYRRDLANTHNSLGILLGDLGNHADAEAEFRAAIREQQRLAGEHPNVPGYRHDLADFRYGLGRLLRIIGKPAEAQTELRAAIKETKRLVQEHPDVPDYRRRLAGSYHELGSSLNDLSMPGDAETQYRTAIKEQQRLVAQDPNLPDYRLELAISRNSLGRLLLMQDKQEEARTELRGALEGFQRLVQEHANVPDYRSRLADTHNNLGSLLDDLGKHTDAEAEHRTAIKEQQRLVEEHPNVTEYRRDLAIGHNNLGLILSRRAKQDEGEAELRAALKDFHRLVLEHASVPEYRSLLAYCYQCLGWLLNGVGRHAAAETEWRAAVRERQHLVDEHPSVPDYRSNLAWCHNALGNVLDGLHKHTEAEVEYRAAIKEQRRLADDNPKVATYRKVLADDHTSLGVWLTHLGRAADAEAEYRAVLAIEHQLLKSFPQEPDCHNTLAGTLVNLAILRRDGHQPREAKKLLNEARPHHEAALKANPNHALYRQFHANNLGVLTPVLVELGDRDGLLALAERYRAGVGEPQDDLYNAASRVSKCVELVQKDGSVAESERADLARSYAEHAMGLLTQALKAGYGNAAWMRDDPDLQPLRGRQDFQKLLAVAWRAETAQATAQIALQEKKVAADPKNTQFRVDLADSHQNLGQIHLGHGNTEQAAGSLQQALALRERLSQEEPKRPIRLSALAETLIALGGLHWQRGRLCEGAHDWQRAAKALEAGMASVGAGAADGQQILDRWRALGSEYVKAGLWSEASACYEKESERGNPQDAREHWLTPALLRLLSADLAGYRQVCGGLRERIEKKTVHEDYVWACSVDERAGVDPSLLVKGAEQIVKPIFPPWLRHIFGLSYYRAGRFEEAVAAALVSNRVTTWPARSLNWPVLAIAHHRLGHAEEARKWLEQANQEWRQRSPIAKAIDTANVLPTSPDDSRFWQTIWQDWGIFQLLLAEANSLILGQRGEADCLDHLHRAYMHAKLGEPKKAEEEFQAAVRGRDKVAGAWLERGRAYRLLGDKERARADFAKARELNPKDPQVQKEYEASSGEVKGGR
jgi:serine/threonine protein kinase/tetratricopeptide (TPR) repeat protein